MDYINDYLIFEISHALKSLNSLILNVVDMKIISRKKNNKSNLFFNAGRNFAFFS